MQNSDQKTDAKPLFDVNREFEIRVPHPDFPDKKPCRLRFPTDQEWAARARRNLQVRRQLGRDAFRTETPHAVAEDAALFEKIRLDKDGPSFEEAEMSVAIARLEFAHVVSCERVGNKFAITLKVARAEVTHLVKMPTLRQMSEFGSGSVMATSRRAGVEMRLALEPAAELYSKLEPKADGYAGAVPIVHKDAVIGEVVLQTRAELEDDDDPEV